MFQLSKSSDSLARIGAEFLRHQRSVDGNGWGGGVQAEGFVDLLQVFGSLEPVFEGAGIPLMRFSGVRVQRERAPELGIGAGDVPVPVESREGQGSVGGGEVLGSARSRARLLPPPF